jgi:hypothetical protein
MSESARLNEGQDQVLHTDTPPSVTDVPPTASDDLGFREGAAGTNNRRGQEIHLTPSLPRHPVLVGPAQRWLRAKFAATVRRNDECLQGAWINRHPYVHMDTVASGVYQLGTQLRIDGRAVLAATFATRFHDVGYRFPPGVDPALLGKAAHARHADLGADMFVAGMKEVEREVGLPDWWEPRHTDLGAMAIRFHSNHSSHASLSGHPLAEDPAIPPLALLPRLIDKLDNTAARVYATHIEAYRAVLYQDIDVVRKHTRTEILARLSSPDRFVQGGDPQEIFEKLRAFAPSFVHQIVPYNITDQRLQLDESDGVLDVTYTVHPSNLGAQLGIDYTPEHFMGHFDEAYERSMRNAAAVVRAIRTRILGLPDRPQDVHMRVHLDMENGQRVTRGYAPVDKAAA